MREALLQVGDLLLTLLEHDVAHLEVGLEACPAALDLRLALVEHARPVGDRLLGRPEPLLAALDPLAKRRDQALGAGDLGLARRELAAKLVESARLLFDVDGGLRLGLLALELGLAAGQLGLA